MIQENKELLLKDICARLPYKVKVEAKGLLKTIADDYDDKNIINAHVLNGLNLRDYFKTYSIDCIVNVPLFNRKGICNIKPYLFPLSSMTVEQMCKVQNLLPDNCEISFKNQKITFYNEGNIQLEQLEKVVNFFNLYHIDYRGLIPKGLAIDATELNIY